MKVHEATMHEKTEEETQKCGKCEKMFKSANALQTHLKIYHANDQNDEDDFKCEKCAKTYSTQRSLNAHLASHAREEGYPAGMDPARVTNYNHAVFYKTDPILYHRFRNMVIFRSGNLYSLSSPRNQHYQILFIIFNYFIEKGRNRRSKFYNRKYISLIISRFINNY